MKIGITNVLADAGALTVTSDDNVAFDIDDIVSSDFSTVYVSAGTAADFTISKTFTVPATLDYVAIGGHNTGINGGTIELRVDGVIPTAPAVGSVVFDAGSFSHVVMWTFPSESVSTLEIKFVKNAPTDQITLANMQCGETFNFVSPINNQEVTGYSRAWMGRSTKIRTVNNGLAQPVASLTRRMSKKVSLQIANLQDQDTDPNQTNLKNFLATIYINTTWYMKERDQVPLDDDPKSSYLCSNGDLQMSAGARSQLNNMMLSFSAFIGT